MKSFAVYYMNQGFWADGITGNGFDEIDPKNLRKTHIYVKTVCTGAEDGAKELVFEMMNHGHRPTELDVLNLNLMHANMSMGDILVDKSDDRVYVCAAFGWRELT